MIAIDMGLAEGKRRCENIGAALGDIETVSEVPRFQLEAKTDGEDEEDEEDEPEIIKYKF